MIQYITSVLNSIQTQYSTQVTDNDVGGVDIVGSWMEIGLVAVALVAGVFFALPVLFKALEKRKKKKAPYLPGNYWQCHSRVHEILTELRVELDCARTQIVQFHNGGDFFDGNPMAKLTMTHESLRTGVSPESPNWRDLQMSTMHHLLEKTKDGKCTLNIPTEDGDNYSKQQLVAANVVAYSIIPLHKNNHYSGFVMCQWCSWNKVDEIVESNIPDLLIDTRNRLQIELDREKKKNK
jgi:hypothetical protein